MTDIGKLHPTRSNTIIKYTDKINALDIGR